MGGFAGGFDQGCDYSYVISNVYLEPRDISASLPRGHGFEVKPAGVLNTVEYNLFANKPVTTIGGGNGLYTIGGSNAYNYLVRYNTVYNWRKGTLLAINGPHGAVTVCNNLLQETQTAARVMYIDGGADNVDMHTQIYYGAAPANDWFRLDGADMDFATWVAQTGDSNSTMKQVTLRDPDRTVGDYCAHLGGSNSFEAFMARCRAQSRDNWDANYTAQRANEWLREGFRPLESLGTEQIGAVWPPVPEPTAAISALALAMAAVVRARGSGRNVPHATCGAG
jgi:hypothetical protein